MVKENQNQIDENQMTDTLEYTPPKVEYIPYEPKENGVRTKLYPNVRDCTSCDPDENW